VKNLLSTDKQQASGLLDTFAFDDRDVFVDWQRG